MLMVLRTTCSPISCSYRWRLLCSNSGATRGRCVCRRLRLSNPHIQRELVETGALELLLRAGFQVHQLAKPPAQPALRGAAAETEACLLLGGDAPQLAPALLQGVSESSPREASLTCWTLTNQRGAISTDDSPLVGH